MIDEKVIGPHFKLPDLFDEKEFEELLEGQETETNSEENAEGEN